MKSWAPEISLSVPTGHWRLTAFQDASSMRLGAVGASPAADLPQLTQHSVSASAPAAAQPSAPSSAPAVSPAGGQQAAMRPVSLQSLNVLFCPCIVCIGMQILNAAHHVMLELEPEASAYLCSSPYCDIFLSITAQQYANTPTRRRLSEQIGDDCLCNLRSFHAWT